MRLTSKERDLRERCAALSDRLSSPAQLRQELVFAAADAQSYVTINGLTVELPPGACYITLDPVTKGPVTVMFATQEWSTE